MLADPEYMLVEFTGYGPWVLLTVFIGVGLPALFYGNPGGTMSKALNGVC